MSDLLKSMIQDIINDRPEQARSSIHQYIVGKTQEVAGLAEAKEASTKFGAGLYLSSSEPKVGEGYDSDDSDGRFVIGVYIGSGNPEDGIAELASAPKVLAKFSEGEEQRLCDGKISKKLKSIAEAHGLSSDDVYDLVSGPGVNYVEAKDGYLICAFGDD